MVFSTSDADTGEDESEDVRNSYEDPPPGLSHKRGRGRILEQKETNTHRAKKIYRNKHWIDKERPVID